ncbi:MAG: hypothetical protein UH543_02940 [Bacteroidales bacterium]|nr:hypothetical protein [Bacteroidales bacterium]
MIKKVIFMLALSMFCVDIMAQPQPSEDPENHATQGVHGEGDNRQGAPVTPATLLLLGLGGAVTGTMVYRNTKKN